MITEELVNRINELASKKKSEGLTPAEQTEQKKLYKIYLASIRQQVTTQLDAAGVESKDHVCNDHCGCGHHHHQHGPDCNHKH